MSELPCDSRAIIDRSLRFSETRYRRLFESAQDGILILNAETSEIEDANPFLINIIGYSHEELVGRTLWDIGAFRDTKLNKEAFIELQTNRYIRYSDLPLERKDGQLIFVEFISNVYDCDGVDVIQCNIRDNSKRHFLEVDLLATTRTLKFLSQSNVALLRSTTETILLDEYCRIAVETGGYLMAWVGLADSGPESRIQPIARYGRDDGYLASGQFTWADTGPGDGPTGRAIRTGEVQFCADIDTDPTMLPWRTAALQRGYRSSIAVPFRLPNGTVACLNLYSASRDAWSAPERQLLQEVAADISFGIKTLRTEIEKVQYQLHLRDSLEQTIQVIADTIDQRDPYTAGHQRRVANLSSAIALELGLAPGVIHGLHLAATIHDLGKIGIPSEILVKPRRLSDNEFNLIKEHVTIGFNILKGISFPWPIAKIIQQHHERLDGSGYPLGLTRDALLLESRILAVADVVEAMASPRPYRMALGIEAALSEIMAHRGTAFDAAVVDACLRLFHEQGYTIED
ncbi:HD domain-containing phosphohydrolase [uncultured Thiodictyon sp.]|uniref:HD domain-containing phosphohydrolase n=1 Tax=uncultured Thiodictyon sp. TaxID=1846217 RepID=UPI0025FCC706|nr:HD domain-containing phosphohydrolase [uncultured Thiodictyon sp.]